jgi:hypothetical protein
MGFSGFLLQQTRISVCDMVAQHRFAAHWVSVAQDFDHLGVFIDRRLHPDVLGQIF